MKKNIEQKNLNGVAHRIKLSSILSCLKAPKNILRLKPV